MFSVLSCSPVFLQEPLTQTPAFQALFPNLPSATALFPPPVTSPCLVTSLVDVTSTQGPSRLCHYWTRSPSLCLPRVQEQVRQQEMESREHLRRRMDAVLALKKNITANRVGAHTRIQ